ncbi:MAG: exodeoxyribonuclease V subunit alpha [Deferribacterales bacterium]
MTDILNTLYEEKFLRDIDIQFAGHMTQVFRADGQELFYAVLFYAVSSAHTCLRTDRLSALPFYERFQVELDECFGGENIKKLRDIGAVSDSTSMSAPIIQDGVRLYLKAFYLHEKNVAKYITDCAGAQYRYDRDRLKNLLTKYFGAGEDMQKAAALNACLRKFCVISGGPGTGKTTTVFRVLAMLSELSEEPLSIGVCAPTGKAAARLTDSIRENMEKYSSESFIERIPQKALTLHRLLKMTGNSELGGYGAENPMPYDIVVADEASMADIRLMSVLAQAMKKDGRLILLGDKDQLASVQPGSVLGDICSAADPDVFTESTAELMAYCAETPVKADSTAEKLTDITIQLKKSRRFDDTKGIGLLAKACRDGDTASAIDVLRNDTSDQIDFIDLSDRFTDRIKEMSVDYFTKISQEHNAEAALAQVSSFSILTPHVKGALGTEGINALTLNTLYQKRLIDNTKKYFHGLPVMITENDYSLNLLNGTTGVILSGDGLRAWFREEDKTRSISVMRLPSWTPQFSMTVHKSQGSEFDHVVFILPEEDSPVITKELFYTAVTRAKTRLTVISSEKAVKNCLKKRTERYSGLFR